MTIRLQLLVAVNATLAILVGLFLVYDYRRDLGERLEDKRIALQEEAKTLLPAVLQMRRQGRDSVQQYVDGVCGKMQETHSPGHHIAVELETDTVQALAHQLPLEPTALRINEALEAYRGAASQHDDVTVVLVELAEDHLAGMRPFEPGLKAESMQQDK